MATLSSPEERTEYFRRLGARSQVGRITLRADEAAALRDAAALLGRVAERLQRDGDHARA
jgi:hypothetical protein